MIHTDTKKKMSVSKATSTLISLILQMPPKEIIATLNDLEKKSRMKDQTEVVFAVDKRFCKGYASAIYAHGLFIETQEKFSPGESITLSFELKKTTQQIKTSGKVARVDPEGIEVEFNTFIENVM